MIKKVLTFWDMHENKGKIIRYICKKTLKYVVFQHLFGKKEIGTERTSNNYFTQLIKLAALSLLASPLNPLWATPLVCEQEK